jgi:hypothetical protein
MKTYSKIIIIALILLLINACNQDYIDPISKVEPGTDEEAPTVTITSPTAVVNILFTETQTDIDFNFEVTDDIEIQDITLSLDGNQLSSYSNFKDYRRALESYTQADVSIGDHTVQVVATDLSGKSTTKDLTFKVSNQYISNYDGEIFYMPFEGGKYMDLISGMEATVVGNPSIVSDGKKGSAYAGAEGAYLTFPVDNLQNDEFSAVFWINIIENHAEAGEQRAGILVMSPIDSAHLADPENMNNRTSGFRFFREVGAAPDQRFKLNAGNGTADTWFDGGTAADVEPNTGNWVNMAFTISQTHCAVYINGEVVKEGDFTGIDWTGCDVFSIMSGQPYFNQWGHKSDQSMLDELRIFNKALTQTEIQTIIDDES